MCMVFAALYPERTSALVLHGAGPRFESGPDWPWGWSHEAATPMLEAAEANWGSGTVLSWFIQGLADDPHTQEATGRFERFAASPAGRQLLEMSFQFDIRSVLSSISAPTLVVHRRWGLRRACRVRSLHRRPHRQRLASRVAWRLPSERPTRRRRRCDGMRSSTS